MMLRSRSSLRPPVVWRPGEHLSLVGQTGTGKSTLAAQLLTTRRWYAVLKSKPDKVKYEGARLIRTAERLDDQRFERFVLSPKYEEQWPEFHAALERFWRQGGWTAYIDELFYLDRMG